jgi:hypothetical protein
MSVYLPRHPVQLDPLIAEAKRRARHRRLVVIVALLALGIGALGRWELSGATASAATTDGGKQCAGPTTYGLQCIDVHGSGLSVDKIQTWNPEAAFQTGGTQMMWRMDLERYLCDPIGKTKSMCSAATTWHGRARTGVPIVDRRALTPHLIQSRRHHYWPTFTTPHTFRSNVWRCTELAFYNSVTHSWVYNAGGVPRGLRACVSVHA